MTTTDDRIAALELDVLLLKTAFANIGKAMPNNAPSAPEGACASDAELDGQHGNEPVRRDPPEKYWSGASCVGLRLSECPADYLDGFAKWKSACSHMNRKDGTPDKLKYAGYDDRDAARARGWAKRLRDGVTAHAAQGTDDGFMNGPTGDDEIPF